MADLPRHSGLYRLQSNPVEKLSELQAHGCVFAAGAAVGDGETSGVADGLAAGRIGPIIPIGPIKACDGLPSL